MAHFPRSDAKMNAGMVCSPKSEAQGKVGGPCDSLARGVQAVEGDDAQQQGVHVPPGRE